MPTPTVYARVSPELKQAVDDFADTHGMSLASAVTDLLETGLEASSSAQSVKGLELRVQQLQAELAQAQQAAVVLDGRLRQQLGVCECGTNLTGRDFLVSGRCPQCNRGVTSLLTSTDPRAGSVDRSELAPFLAGLGAAAALVAVLYVTTQN